MVLLTSQDFVKSISNLDDNLQAGYLSPAIREAQETELQQVLGSKLMKKLQDLVESGDIEDEDYFHYKELLEKCQYFIAYSAIVRVILICSVKLSNIGANQAEDEKIKSLSMNDIMKLQGLYQNKADAYKKALQGYIMDNIDNFPELNENSRNEMQSNLYSAASSGIFLGGARGKKGRKSNGVSYSGGKSGGGEGTTDYNELDNKPKINGVALKGNKSSAELGLAGADELQELRDDCADEFESIHKDLEGFGIGKKITKRDDYLYETEYTSLDYDYAREYFEGKVNINQGMCSAYRSGNFIGRNYDYFDDYEAVFTVKTPAISGRRAVIGVASHSDLSVQTVDSGADSEAYRILPFYLQDGVNDKGLFAEINLVPLPENINRTVEPLIEKRDRICSIMLVRYILDNFDSVDSAVEYLRDYVEIFNPDGLIDMDYEVHYMVADRTKTVVLEFINGRLVIINNINDEPVNRLTNFHLYGVQFLSDGKVYQITDINDLGHTPSSIGIEDYGSGLERWNKMTSYSQNFNRKEHIDEVMRDLYFTKAYTVTGRSDVWYSEFVGGDITVDTPDDNQAFITRINNYRQKYIERTKDNPETWITAHSSVYDIDKQNLFIRVQERDAEYGFQLNDRIPETNSFETFEYNGLVYNLQYADGGSIIMHRFRFEPRISENIEINYNTVLHNFIPGSSEVGFPNSASHPETNSTIENRYIDSFPFLYNGKMYNNPLIKANNEGGLYPYHYELDYGDFIFSYYTSDGFNSTFFSVIKKSTELPVASDTTLGGIKVGSGLTIDENGVLNNFVPEIPSGSGDVFLGKGYDGKPYWRTVSHPVQNFQIYDELPQFPSEKIGTLGLVPGYNKGIDYSSGLQTGVYYSFPIITTFYGGDLKFQVRPYSWDDTVIIEAEVLKFGNTQILVDSPLGVYSLQFTYDDLETPLYACTLTPSDEYSNISLIFYAYKRDIGSGNFEPWVLVELRTADGSPYQPVVASLNTTPNKFNFNGEPSRIYELSNSGWVERSIMPYQLPAASQDTLGGIKVGQNLSIDSNGVLSATANVASSTISNIWTGTQAQYDAIEVKDNNTLYFINDAN